MKSINKSPFDWKAKPSTLFTPSEKATMRMFAVTRSTDRKQIHVYSKAGTK